MVRSGRAAVLAICLLLAIVHTWPLALHPGRYSRNDNADTELNEWILAWVAHQLPRDPIHLFDANIFFPARDSLAFSEPLIVPGAMGAPLAWAGASPVLVYNIVLIAGFALTAFATCLLVEAWTGSLLAGLIAGSLFAFNTHTLTRLSHVQAVHLYGLPLALFAIDRIVRGERTRGAAGLLSAGLALLAYTSGYLIVFGLVMVALALAARVPEWIRRAPQVAASLGIAAALALIAILPVYLPYRRVEHGQRMLRTLDIIKDYSAAPSGYLATAGRVHFATWSGRLFTGRVESFFPGFVILALAAIAIAAASRRSDGATALLRARVVMLGAIAAAGFLLSLGTATPIYGWLYTIFPPMQGLRAAARFGNLFLLAIAVLGGIGAARIRRTWVAALLVLLVNVESLRAPFTFYSFEGIPRVYSALNDERGPVILAEVPFYPPWAIFRNAPYELASTAHWKPLMNGYSGFTPDGYDRYAESFWPFPNESAIQAMKDAGVTHVMIHPVDFPAGHVAVIPAIELRNDFELVASGRDIRLYRLKR